MSEVHVSIACQNNIKQWTQAMNKADAANANQAEIDKLMRDLVKDGLSNKKPNWWQKYNEFVINSMLSGLGTPLVNFVSNTVQTVAKPTINLVRSAFGNDKIAKREASAMFSAMFDGLKQDLIFFNKGFQTGMPVDFELSPRALGMTQKEFNKFAEDLGAVVDPRTGTITPQDAQRALSASYDYITKAIPGRVGEIIRIPTRATVAIDEYFKARLRNQKTYALLSRKASMDEAAGKGSYEKLYEQYKKEAFYDIKEPPANLSAKEAEDWRIQEAQKRADYTSRLERVFGGDDAFTTALYDVRNYATDGTFQTKLTGGLEKLSSYKGQGDTAGKTVANIIVPFLRTPWNLTMEGFSYIPGAGIIIKPGVTKTTKKVKVIDGVPVTTFETNIVKMDRGEVAARQVIGAGMVAGMGALWANDRLTGSIPDSAADRAQWAANGKQPYSIKVGDTWISYQRVDPFSTVLGLAADTFEMGRKLADGSIQPGKEIDETLAASWGMLKQNILQKTFMQGFADIAGALDSPAKLGTYFDNLAKRHIPALSNTLARGFDPYEREAVGTVDKLKQRVPGLRQTLPESYANYSADPNNPAPRETNVVQAFTGFGVSGEPTEFQKRMEAVGVKFSPKSATMQKVKLDTEQLADYKRFSNEFASKFFLRALPNLEKMPNKQVQQTQARKLMSEATKYARYRLMKKYPELRADIQAQSNYDKYGIVEEE